MFLCFWNTVSIQLQILSLSIQYPMQFSVVALSLVSASVALAADAISQISDGQIQATSATETSTWTSATDSSTWSATDSSTWSATESSTWSATESATSSVEIATQTENGANQVVGGAAFAGLIAAGAMLI